MYAAGQFPIVSGVQTQVLPQNISLTYQWVVIFNNGSVPLLVSWAGFTDILQPDMANAYKLIKTNPLLTFEPISSYPNGTFIGAVSAVYYTTSEDSPAGYPMPLTEFPGGGTPLLLSSGSIILQGPSAGQTGGITSDTFTLSGTVSVPLGYILNGTTYQPLTLALPPGASSLSINGPLSVIVHGADLSPVGSLTLEVLGVQSGVTLGSVVVASAVALDETQNLNQTIQLAQYGDATVTVTAKYNVSSGSASACQLGSTGLNIYASPSGLVSVINAPNTALNVDAIIESQPIGVRPSTNFASWTNVRQLTFNAGSSGTLFTAGGGGIIVYDVSLTVMTGTGVTGDFRLNGNVICGVDASTPSIVWNSSRGVPLAAGEVGAWDLVSGSAPGVYIGINYEQY